MKYDLEENLVIKNDPNGNIACLNKNINLIVIANDIVAEIINNKDIHDPKDIIDKIKKRYTTNPDDNIEKDVVDTLYKLDAFQIVHIKEEHKIKNSDKFIGDTDYRQVSRFCQENINNKNIYDASFGQKEYYSIYNIRTRCFNGYEYGVAL